MAEDDHPLSSIPLDAELSNGGNLRSAFRFGSAAVFPRSFSVFPGFSAIRSLWENSCRCHDALISHSLHLKILFSELHFSDCRNLFGLLTARAVSPMLVLFRRFFSGGQRCPHVALAAAKRCSERAVLLTRCKSFFAVL